MPRTTSAKRALRKTARRTKDNLKRKKQIKVSLKALEAALGSKDKAQAAAALRVAQKQIDKATKSFLHANKAARLKSRLARRVYKISLTK